MLRWLQVDQKVASVAWIVFSDVVLVCCHYHLYALNANSILLSNDNLFNIYLVGYSMLSTRC